MIVVWRRVKRLPDDPERARMWLFSTARATLLNHARGERRRLVLADRIRSNVGIGRASPPAHEGDEVRYAIARFGPGRAELVWLVHWDRFTSGRAELLGTPRVDGS